MLGCCDLYPSPYSSNVVVIGTYALPGPEIVLWVYVFSSPILVPIYMHESWRYIHVYILLECKCTVVLQAFTYASILNKLSIVFSPHVISPAGECLWQWYCTICGGGSSLARPTAPDLHTESRAEYGEHSVPTDTVKCTVLIAHIMWEVLL